MRRPINCFSILVFIIVVILLLNTRVRENPPENVKIPQFFNREDVGYGLFRRHENSKMKITILMVTTGKTDPKKYQTAIETTKCYSKIHGYEFLLVTDADYPCHQKDKFFRRHCVVSNILASRDIILFLDADIGVINPKRKIEEYMDEQFDIIFYDRFYNWEVTAGSFIVRNTEYSRNFLEEFSNYETQLPKGYHGTDNGAIHIFLARKLFPNSKMDIDFCQNIYNLSKTKQDLFTYEACVRTIFGSGTDFGKVRIIHKGLGWARDNWLTSGVWHPDLDFMFHGIKMNQLKTPPNGTVKPDDMNWNFWHNPLAGPIDLDKCGPQNSTWNYDPRLIGNREEILASLNIHEKRVTLDRFKSLARIPNLMKNK